MLDRIDRILEWWSRALLALAVLAGFAMMIHVTFDVFMRTVMHSPLRQTNQTVAAYYMIAATFLPIAFLGLRDDHIPGFRFPVGVFTRQLAHGVQPVVGCHVAPRDASCLPASHLLPETLLPRA